MAKDRTALRTQARRFDSISAPTIAVGTAVRTVFRMTAIMAAPARVAAPTAIAAIDHRRWSIITRRFVDYRRGCSPTKRVDIDVEVYVREGGSACRQRKRDNSK
jgi:hypothetical protein